MGRKPEEIIAVIDKILPAIKEKKSDVLSSLQENDIAVISELLDECKKVCDEEKERKGPEINKSGFDYTKLPLWKKVVDDINYHFGMVDANGMPVFRSWGIKPQEEYGWKLGKDFTYGFANAMRKALNEKGYYCGGYYDSDNKMTEFMVSVEDDTEHGSFGYYFDRKD